MSKHKKRKIFHFFMNWGWIFLLLIILYGALGYFDIVPPFDREYCKIEEKGIECIDFVYDGGQIQLAIENQKEDNMTDTKIEIDGCKAESSEKNLDVGKNKIYKIDCNKTRVIKEDILFIYINPESGLRHKSKGEIKLFPK